MAAPERLDPAHTALVVFDMQKGQFELNDPQRLKWIADSNIVANAVALLKTARAAGLPVFYVQNTRRPDFADQKEVLTDSTVPGAAPSGPVAGTRPWEIIDELTPEPQDWIVPKYRHGAFGGTAMDTLLRARGIETLV